MTSQFRSKNTVELEEEKQLLLAARDELEADKFDLKADRANFEAEKLQWQLTKCGSSAKASCDCQATKAGLEAERLQLEKEKTQLRVAQSQLKTVQSQLEAAKSQLETAQTQLEKAREQLEIATKHLEAAKAQTDIDNNTRLEAAKASLEAAKLRFGAATKQLNAAKSRLEAAKTRFDLASSSIEAEKSNLKDQKAALEIKVSEVESEKAKLEVKVSQLENDKFELGSELQGSKAEVERLLEKMKEVVKKLEQCCKDKKALPRSETSSLHDTNEKVKPDVQSVEIIRKVNVKKVFLDLVAVNGRIAGRLVIELDFDATPQTAENFRALCTGERGVDPSTGMPLHYKGSNLYQSNAWCHSLPDGRRDDGIYGPIYPDENLTKKHIGPGIVSMQTTPGDAYFFITYDNGEHAQWDGKHVVFGQVVEGMNVLVDMGNSRTTNCMIADCGQVSE